MRSQSTISGKSLIALLAVMVALIGCFAVAGDTSVSFNYSFDQIATYYPESGDNIPVGAVLTAELNFLAETSSLNFEVVFRVPSAKPAVTFSFSQNPSFPVSITSVKFDPLLLAEGDVIDINVTDKTGSETFEPFTFSILSECQLTGPTCPTATTCRANSLQRESCQCDDPTLAFVGGDSPGCFAAPQFEFIATNAVIGEDFDTPAVAVVTKSDAKIGFSVDFPSPVYSQSYALFQYIWTSTGGSQESYFKVDLTNPNPNRQNLLLPTPDVGTHTLTFYTLYSSSAYEYPGTTTAFTTEVVLDCISVDGNDTDTCQGQTTCQSTTFAPNGECACPDPTKTGPNCDQTTTPVITYSYGSGPDFDPFTADILFIERDSQIKATFARLIVAGSARLQIQYDDADAPEANYVENTFTAGQTDFTLTLTVAKPGKAKIFVSFPTPDAFFPNQERTPEFTVALDCISAPDGDDSCPQNLATCQSTTGAPNGECVCADYWKKFIPGQSSGGSTTLPSCENAFVAPVLTFLHDQNPITAPIFIPTGSPLSVKIDLNAAGSANTGLMTFTLTPVPDGVSPMLVTQQPAAPITFSIDLAVVFALTLKVQTQDFTFPDPLVVGQFSIVTTYGTDVILTPDSYDPSPTIERGFSCLDYSDNTFTVKPTQDTCGLNGKCDAATGCTCDDGYGDSTCDLKLTEPSDVAITYKLIGSDTAVALVTDTTLGLALIDEWELSFTFGNVGGTVHITFVDLKDATNVVKVKSFDFDDDATISFPSPTLGGAYRIDVSYTIANWAEPPTFSTDEFELMSACFDADDDFSDTCGDNGSCSVDGTCQCTSGWGGDECDELLRIPVAITVPSIKDAAIAIKADGDSGATQNVVLSAGAAIKVVFSPILNAPSMASDITVEMWYYPLLAAQTVPSTQLIKLTSQKVKFIDEALTVDLVAPQLNSQTIFIKISVTSEAIPNYTATTIPFTALPTCFVQPTTTDVTVVANWTSQCENGGNCAVDNSCVCATGFYGSTCQFVQATTPYNACDVCVSENLDSCNDDTKLTDRATPCKCKKNFGGLTCSDRNKCLLDSLKKCNYGNWQGKFDTQTDGTCATQCSCETNWTGTQCESCSLTCQNNGEAFKACSRCGCAAGFGGDSCQCKSALLQVVINGQNDVVEATNGVYGGVDGAFNATLTNDVALQLLLVDFESYFATLLGVEQTQVDVKAEPFDDGNTRFNVTLQYACSGGSLEPFIALAEATTIEELSVEWDTASAQVPADMADKINYGTATPAVVSKSASASESTLPGSGEGINAAPSVGMMMVAFVVVFATLMF